MTTEPDRPEPPENIRGRFGVVTARGLALTALALGWLLASAAIGYRCGWWLTALGAGVGLLLAGGAYFASRALDALLSAALVYFGRRPEGEGSSEERPARGGRRIVTRG